VKGSRFSRKAQRDLREILAYVERENGLERAIRFRAEVLRAAANLARHPHMGHERPDLTARPFRFWPVFAYLLVYEPGSVPLNVAHIVHGARDPSDLRDRIREPALTLEHYAAASSS